MRIYRSPLFGFGVVLPGILLAVFWGQREYLNPVYWSRDGLAVLAKFEADAEQRAPEAFGDWGHDTVPRPNVNTLTVAGLLRARDFAALQALARRAPGSFNRFEDSSPDLAAALDEWVVAEPDSPNPLLARGHYWYNIGWMRRGEKLASATTDSQFSDMRDAFGRAEADFLAALDLDASVPYAYPPLVSIYSTSRRRRDDLAGIVRRAIDADAVTTGLYRKLFVALQPHWSGLSREESVAAVQSVIDQIEAGTLPGAADLELLRAYPVFVEAVARWRAEQRDEALRLFETFVDGRSGVFLRDDYAWLLRGAGRRGEALRYFAASLRAEPPMAGMFEDYASLLVRVRHDDKALEIMEWALSLDPFEPDILVLRGDLHVRYGRLREALADFKRAEVHGGQRSAVAARLHWVRNRLDD